MDEKTYKRIRHDINGCLAIIQINFDILSAQNCEDIDCPLKEERQAIFKRIKISVEKIQKYIAEIKGKSNEKIFSLSLFDAHVDFLRITKSLFEQMELELVDMFYTKIKKNDMNPEDFFKAVRKKDCEMCGHAAVLTLLFLARESGAKEIRLLHYANSGDVPAGDRKKVVGYAAMAVVK